MILCTLTFKIFMKGDYYEKFKWINIFKGFGMGTSDLVPGVSGGTIALLLGIYDDFISSISGLFSRRFWPSLKFLLPILVGMLIAIGLLSQLFNYLLSQHHIPTMLFFTGLILGIIPYLLTISNFKKFQYNTLFYSIIRYCYYSRFHCLIMETSIQVEHLLYLSVLSLNILSQVFSLQVLCYYQAFLDHLCYLSSGIWDANVCYF